MVGDIRRSAVKIIKKIMKISSVNENEMIMIYVAKISARVALILKLLVFELELQIYLKLKI